MSADLDGGAAPASLDDLVVVETLTTPAHDGGAAPLDAADIAEGGVAEDGVAEDLADSEDAGPAPDPDN